MTMPFATGTAPVTDDEVTIAAHLQDADLPALLPALAYSTGDLSLLRDDLRPDPLLVSMGGGLTDEQAVMARALAHEVLAAFRDSGSVAAPPPGDRDLLAILEHTVGGEAMDAYLPLLIEELGGNSETDPRAPSWTIEELSPSRHLRAAVIGAGMSGLLAAHRLLQAGIHTVVFEKSEEVGGTWLDNRYPGCRVDNPNHAYSYSFAQRHDWPNHYSTQPALLEYFCRFADHFGLRDHVRFATEVTAAEWSDERCVWTVTARSSPGDDREEGGHTERLDFDMVVSAVGQLNRPSYPDIDGLDSFRGPSFHSARWDDAVLLDGRRVAVIGTGASAVQFIPEIAKRAGTLLVFQRTPPWLAPTPNYHEAVAPGLQWLYRHLPGYSALSRFAMFWRLGDQALEAVRVDPTWPTGASASGSFASVSALNDFARQVLTGYLQAEFADRPDLLEHVLPTYPVGAKRILRDDGTWSRTLKRPNVRLVVEPISELTERGVRTRDGSEHPVDVVVYGTGFRAGEFLMPMRVTGRAGAELHELWGDEARAYLGITIPGFPNFFCLYGPNTNIVVNGSIVYFSECAVRYVLGCIRLLLERRARTLEVRPEVHDEFNRRVDAANLAMAWGASDVNSWYKNRRGRVTQNWPFTLLDYWRWTLEPAAGEYQLG